MMTLLRGCLVLALCKIVWSQTGNDLFTIDDYFSGAYNAYGYGGVWISDNEIQYRDSAGNVAVLNVDTNASSIVVASGVLNGKIRADSYSFSADRKFLLISYNTQSQFRHSTTAQFLISALDGSTVVDVANSSFLQTATWGRGADPWSLLYVLDNDIYYTRNFTSKEPTRITNDGIPGIIYNGVPDWAYEEEVIGAATAYWFSPDGRGLVFIQFNDTFVPTMTYQRYGEPGTIQDQYPAEISIKYPKAGTTNPVHSAFYVDLSDPDLQPQLIRSDPTGSTVTYGFTWAGKNFVELVKNRVQNESSLSLFGVDDQLQSSTIKESANPDGWDVTDIPLFDSTGQYYLNIESVQNAQDDGSYRHLVQRDVSNSSYNILTRGNRVVLSIVAWDVTNSIVYYSGTVEDVPSRTQVYQVNYSNGADSCITCQLLTADGQPCVSASARFSQDFTNVILTCNGPSPSITAIYKNEVPLGEPTLVLQDNAPLRESLKKKALPTILDTKVDTAEGFTADVRLLLPPNFNESNKYPLLIEVYGGPDYNQIIDGYSVGWETYLSSSLGIIYGFIDGRGSGRSSDQVLFAGYRNLGTVEIYDQINVTRSLQRRFSWIDGDRSAIWGWSYGGYATGRTMELDTDGVFKCGISVAPVTSWLYYDSIYTERYMGLPTEEDNLKGYVDGDLVSHVENIRTKQYYLIHGSGDDNVHYQQSMLLSRALEVKDVLFQQQSYPDENHSLGGVSHHLYHSMDKFWKNCFGLQ